MPMSKERKNALLNTPVVTQYRDLPPQDAVTDADTINAHFEEAFRKAPNHEFLGSLDTWWQEKGFLTEKQFEALCKFSGPVKLNFNEEDIPF